MELKRMIIKNVNSRKNIDLRMYSGTIQFCIRKIIGNASVVVLKDQFTIYSTRPITNTQARVIGREIVKQCPELAAIVREYWYGKDKKKRSGQLFRNVI